MTNGQKSLPSGNQEPTKEPEKHLIICKADIKRTTRYQALKIEDGEQKWKMTVFNIDIIDVI